MENGSEDSAGKTPEELATEKQTQNRKPLKKQRTLKNKANCSD